MTGSKTPILVVDESRSLRAELVGRLVGNQLPMDVVPPGDEALRLVATHRPHVVIVGLGTERERALAFIEAAHQRFGTACSFIAIDRGQSAAGFVGAMRRGADHVLSWPVQADALALVVSRALDKPRLAREVERARDGVFDALAVGDLDRIVGAHPTMQRLLAKVMQAAKSRATVLIHGETGTGKELIAAALHEHSKRAHGPFVCLNCAALSDTVLESELFGHEKGAFTGASARRKGRFEQAAGGTLFLDEVSEISLAVQVKLLRFLQQREFERVGGNETLRVDVRIVAATNTELRQMVDEGRFREDLYYRLNVVRVDVPPLRARPSDIPLLAEHFLRRYAEENEKAIHGFAQRARDALLAHPWPGNVRELQNAVEQAVVLCEGDTVDVEDLPMGPAPAELEPLRLMIPGVTLAELERYAILRTLEACGGSPSKAAAILGISRRTIQYRLSEWGVSRPGPDTRESPRTIGLEPDPTAPAEADNPSLLEERTPEHRAADDPEASAP